MMAFAVLIGGQLLSFVGTTLTAMAVGIWVFEETGSLVSFAWLLILTLVPAILILPFGGLIADRLPRKPAMIVVECLSVSTSAAVLALMASERLEIWHLFVHAALNGVALGLQRPLYESTTPLMVPKERLGSVNGIVHSVAGLGQVLAPVMAGTLVFTIGLERVLMLDLATFSRLPAFSPFACPIRPARRRRPPTIRAAPFSMMSRKAGASWSGDPAFSPSSPSSPCATSSSPPARSW